MSTLKPSPKASIWVIAYNHEKFIAQALESILVQDVNFDYEIVIGEDCSTDNTRKIIQAYEAKYPAIVKPLYHEKNVGLHQNAVKTLEACSGKYIALLEGDDYWTDPYKFQKQVDFLEANEQYSFCCHATAEVNENTEVFKIASRDITDISLSYVLENGWFIRTNSIVLRKDALSDGFPEFFYTAYSTDYILQVMLLKRGNAYYLPDIMSAYRRHPAGISNASKEVQVKRWVQTLALLDTLDDFTNNVFRTEIEQHKREIKQSMSFFLLRNLELIKTLGLGFYFERVHIASALRLF